MPDTIQLNCFEKCFPVLACLDSAWRLTFASQMLSEWAGPELAGKKLFDIFKTERSLPGLDLDVISEQITREELFLSTKDDAYALRGKLVRCDCPDSDTYYLVATPWLNWFKDKNIAVDPENMGLALLDSQLEAQVSASVKDSLVKDIEDLSRSLSEQRRRAEAANDAKTRFVRHISHEVRTPLNGIINSVELLLDENDRGKQKNLLGMIDQSAKSLTRLVGDVLDFSKLEQGAFPVKSQVFNIKTMLKELVSTHEIDAKSKGVNLQLQVNQDIPDWANSDRLAIIKVLNSLIGNAILHSNSSSVDLEISSGETIGRSLNLTFVVRDYGVGIPAEELGKVFEPFWTSYTEMTGQYAMGLGLSIARNIANGLGGTIEVASEPGRGATFTFRCPIQIAQAPRSQVVNHSPRHITHPTFSGEVLLVDDNQINLELARILLTKLGLSVTTAANGKQAVEDEQRIAFDLIIMDIAMPVMNGVEATRKIRKAGRNRGVPIIAFTANVSGDDVDNYLDAGMNDMLAKPASQSAIIKFCERYLAAVEQVQAREAV